MRTKSNIVKLLSVFFLVSVNFSFAQKNEATPEKHKPSIIIGVSGLKFYGYVGSNSNLNPLFDARLGYFIAVEQRFGKILGVEVTGLYGKLAGTDNSVSSHLNFQSQIMQGHIMLTANFDKVFKEDPLVSPFLNVGIGYMLFNSYTDLTRANGDTMHYWSDGSIKNLSENSPFAGSAKVIDRDYTYETQLKTNNTTGTLVMPMGGGLNFHFGRNWTTSIGVNYTMCFTQWIDGAGKNGNSYVSANVGLQYEFKKKPEEDDGKPNVNYDNVDFASIDHLDADKDGVSDDIDNCLGTPAGVHVSASGCPLDGDRDGVPDYLDKEGSAPGAKVDGYGVTINEKEMIKHQKSWDALAPERSKEFNVAPSQEYLNRIEAESRKAHAPPKTAKKIPDNLLAADFNKDGQISASEITEAINAFFEGNANFTIDSINRLIEFFFE